MTTKICTMGTWVMAGLCAAALVMGNVGEAQAQSRVAAGFGLGLIVGGLAGQVQSQGASEKAARTPERRQSAPESRSYTSCVGIYGAGAVNSSSNPAKCVCQTGYRWTNEGGQRCVPSGSETARSSEKASTRGVRSEKEPASTPLPKPPAKPDHVPTDMEKTQEALNLLGYDAGSVDGNSGLQTQQAILRYQANKQFPLTGQLTDAERKALLRDAEAKRVAGLKR